MNCCLRFVLLLGSYIVRVYPGVVTPELIPSPHYTESVQRLLEVYAVLEASNAIVKILALLSQVFLDFHAL